MHGLRLDLTFELLASGDSNVSSKRESFLLDDTDICRLSTGITVHARNTNKVVLPNWAFAVERSGSPGAPPGTSGRHRELR